MQLRKLVGYFLRGALVTAPLGLTLYLVLTVLTTLDRVLPVGIPGLGLLITLLLITAIGAFTSNVVGRSVLESTERFMSRVPLVKLVYNSIKDLIGAFVGDRKSFDKPVAVRPQRDSELRLLGFVTRQGLGVLGFPSHVAVYLPQSYNFAGQLVIVPSELVEPIDVASGELMTFIVSGGVSGLGVGQSLLPPPPR
ncbi:MAG TPA: DUF502 domain-containing protein [Polyangiaceae bacterium]|nr:DUF502 domain-containing protein [Polyangiaceae bacterium]